jgi:lysophospholipase L1-like esterase
MRRTKLSVGKKLLFAAVTVVGLFGVAEVGARLIHGWNRHWLDCHRYHPKLGWCLRENWAGKWSWTGGFARISPEGLRSDTPIGPKPPGEKRLLILGDSVTFGANVRTAEAYPQQLDARCRQAGWPWRVLNGGVTSYDPAQEVEWFEEFGLHLQPDALAVGFCHNDLWASRRTQADELGTPLATTGLAGNWLTEHSLIAFKLHRGLGHLHAAIARRTGERSPMIDVTAPVNGWDLVASSYRRLAELARQRQLPVCLLVFPSLESLQPTGTYHTTGQVTRLGEELGWLVIDLAPAFAPHREAYFLPNDTIHPNAAGYAAAAATIFQTWQTKAWLHPALDR